MPEADALLLDDLCITTRWKSKPMCLYSFSHDPSSVLLVMPFHAYWAKWAILLYDRKVLIIRIR